VDEAVREVEAKLQMEARLGGGKTGKQKKGVKVERRAYYEKSK